MIEAARTALASGDARTALVQLLAAWRQRPARVLAEAIEAVGLVAARGLHPPGGVDAADRDERWIAEARHGDPVMRQRLVETIHDTSSAVARVARAKALAEVETDPRTAMGIVALVTARFMPWHEQYSTVWTPLFDLLARSGDPRVRRAISRTRWDEVVLGTRKQKDAFHVRLAKYQARLAEAIPDKDPELGDAERHVAGDILDMARAPAADDAELRATEEALLAAVHAAPGDMGARAIYADWLQEHGDPRGELIALQLAHPEQAPPEIRVRMQELLAQHRPKWLGEIGARLQAAVFRGGFLDEVTFCRNGYDCPYEVPPPHPMWSTVRLVHGGVPASDALPMPILERAFEIDHRGMSTLARLAQPPPLRELGWRGVDPHHDGDAVADFATLLPRVPTLRRFALRGDGAEQLAWAWRGSSIRAVAVEAPSARLAHWLDEARVLDEILVNHDGWRTTLTADGHLCAKQGYSGNFASVLPHLEAALDRVAQRITKLEITVGAKSEWRAPERKRMDSILRRHPQWADRAQIYGYTDRR